MSYSHEDADWVSRIETMLKPEVGNRNMQLWIDRLIDPGRTWREEIADAIARADCALLLVSPDFLASDFIMRWELAALMQGGVPLVPVLLRACRYRSVKALERVQWAHDPVRDGPIAAQQRKELVDGAIVQATDGLVRVLDDQARAAEPRGPRPVADVQQSTALAGVPALTAGRHGGALDGVPEAPPGFVEREELAELRAALIGAGDGAVAITGGTALGLHGQGGIGKTVLAAALARDGELRSHFPDGVYWVTLGEGADLLSAQMDLLSRLDASADGVRTTTEGLALLREALAARRCLLIVDDVWSAAAANAFDATDALGRVLYTTRDPTTLDGVRADVRRIEVLSPAAAKLLLAGMTGMSADALPAEAERVLATTGRIALALSLVGAAVGRGGRTWQEVADQLDNAGGMFRRHPYANVFKAMQVAVATLEPELAEAHESLAVYPEDTRVTIAAVARFWTHLYALSPAQTRDRLEQLARRELLSLDGDAIALHDLQREFLVLRADSLRRLHQELLNAYRLLLPAGQMPWRLLPGDEAYVWEHLLHHLRAAGDVTGARDVATDLGYLAVRILRSGPHAAEGDVRRAARLAPGDPSLAWVLRHLSQWGHLLTGHDRIGDLAATLALGTSPVPPGVDPSGLHALLPTRALKPRWGLRAAPSALLRVLDSRSIRVLTVACSPDGLSLASAAAGGDVQLWDLGAGTQHATLEGHYKAVIALAYSADGQTLLSAGYDGTMRLWDVAAAAQISGVQVHGEHILAAAFSPDGRTLAIADAEKIRLWDTGAGKPTADLEGRGSACAFSPDGRVLASGGDDAIRLWDVPSGTQVAALPCGRYGGSTLAFSPEGRTLASTGFDRRLQLWDVIARLRTAEHYIPMGGASDLAFSPDGRTLAGAGSDEMVRLWDVRTGTEKARFDGHRGGAGATSVTFSRDGRVVASGGDDGAVRLWDAASTQTAAHEDHGYFVRSLAVSPDGRTLLSAGGDRGVRRWDVRAGIRATVHAQGSVGAVAFAPDGRTFACGETDRELRLWDAASDKPMVILERQDVAAHPDSQAAERRDGNVNAVAFSPDGQTLASGGQDGIVRLWDIAARAQTAALEAHVSWVIAVAFSPDGRTLTSGANDKKLRLWDVGAGVQRAELDSRGYVKAVAVSPDGTIASAGFGVVQLWDATNGTEIAVLEGHATWLQSLAFSSDGRTLAIGDHDGTLGIWDVATRTEILAVRLGSSIGALAFDGGRGIAVGIHRTVAYLDLVDRSEIDAA